METLSEIEIDLLPRSDEKGSGPALVGSRDRPEAQAYDFRRTPRISKERVRTIEALYGRLTRSLEGWLIGRVRGQIELTLQGVEQHSFGEFSQSLSTPCCSYLFEVNGWGGQTCVVDFGQEFAFYLVDRLFGGSGSASVPERALTPIERMAVRVVADRVATLACDLYDDHAEMKLALTGWESIPEILQVGNRDDPVLVATIQVVGPDLQSRLMICVPFTVLERLTVNAGDGDGDARGVDRERASSRELAETSLRTTNVDLAVRLPEFRLSLRDVANLEVGSVLGTGIPSGTSVEVLASGQRRFHAAPGRIGGKLAVRVLDPIEMIPRATGALSSNETND